MKNRSIKYGIRVVLSMLVLSGSAQATTLVLPEANYITVGQYGDFGVYSLDLLKQCASNPLCQPFVTDGPGLTVKSAAAMDDQLTIYAENGGQRDNYKSPSGPFAGSTPAIKMVDNYFQSPTGSVTSFQMNAGNEPDSGTAEFTNDLIGRWDAKLSTVAEYLGGSDLIFIFDNNEQGNTSNQTEKIWAQVRILKGDGTLHKCYELNNSGPGCTSTADDPMPALSDYVAMVGDFCVKASDGTTYPAGSGGSCNSGDYYVNNNLGTDAAEFAAYIKELNDNLDAWAAAGYFMSVNMKLDSIDAGADRLWICSDCTIGQQVPEPESAALVGLGLIGLAAMRRRKKQG